MSTRHSQETGDPILRVASVNIAHGRGLARFRLGKRRLHFESNLGKVASMLRRECPDIVALQEADAANRLSGTFNHVVQLQRAANYRYYFHGVHTLLGHQKAHICHGTAILAQQPLRQSFSSAFEIEPLDSKGVVGAHVQFANRRVVVASVHLDFKSAHTRQRQAWKLIELLQAHHLPLVLMGDFNCGLHTPRRDALKLIIQELDLHTFEPESMKWMTYHAKRPKKRLDWILASSSIRFVDHRVYPDLVSDHLAVAADLSWNPKRSDMKKSHTTRTSLQSSRSD